VSDSETAAEEENVMKMLMIGGAAALLLATAGPASAQMKTITGDTQKVTVTVEAIDRTSREVTVKKPDGTHDFLVVPEGIKRFDTLKVGDHISAEYHISLLLRVKAPSEKPVNQSSSSVIRSGEGPTTLARERTITATISAIDMNAPSISFKGANGWTYSSRVQDKEALAKVKVGDRLDLTFTEALVMAVTDGK
jgi:Cu/Ag efflux protein CusF